MEYKYPDYASWFDRELQVGDELTVRILGAGNCDLPKSTALDEDEEEGIKEE